MMPRATFAGLDVNIGRWARRVTVLVVVVTAGGLVDQSVAAQEPVVLTGMWVGTWWMGKYEEPVELSLIQTHQDLVGHVVLQGYPRAGASSTAVVRAPVTGTVTGSRARLTWTMPEHGQFWAELTILSQDGLFGVGGLGATTTGFGLHRSP
jgi:hypothetical protein